jgi:hypothetical protein
MTRKRTFASPVEIWNIPKLFQELRPSSIGLVHGKDQEGNGSAVKRGKIAVDNV